jgi:hypothetical protein
MYVDIDIDSKLKSQCGHHVSSDTRNSFLTTSVLMSRLVVIPYVFQQQQQDLKLDKRQQKKIRSLGGSDETTCSTRILQMLTLVRQELRAQMARRKAKMERLVSVITPVQTAKFLEWVERNQACIHLLNSMWLKADHVADENEAAEVVQWFMDRQRTNATAAAAEGESSTGRSSSSIAPLLCTTLTPSKTEPVTTPLNENECRQEPNMYPAATTVAGSELQTPLMMFQDDVMAVADLF